MRKIIQKEVQFCDKCGKEYPCPTACMACGIEMCYDCQTKHGVLYNHSVYLNVDLEGFYCKPCDVALTKSKKDKRHNAYRRIKALKHELDVWHSNFQNRLTVAEKALKPFSN